MQSHGFVFVTGLHRSGTSPLHRCLRSHPQISGFHDTGVSEDEGQHLQNVLPRPVGGPGRFGRHPDAHITESHPFACAGTADALFAQWRPYWDLSKPYLLEKSPPTLLRTRLFQALFPDSYFVVIVRHPVAVALATFNALAWGGPAQQISIDELVEHWLVCHEAFEEDAAELKRLQVVRYEDFAARPQQTIDSVCEFLDLPAQPVSEEVLPSVNTVYRSQWRAMCAHAGYRAAVEQALKLEDRVNRFGYSLEQWADTMPGSEPAKTMLETERLILRRFTFEDVDDLEALCADPATMLSDEAFTTDQIWSVIAMSQREYERNNGLHFWSVVHKADMRFIGRCGLLIQTVDGREEAEVAYTIARQYWNQGLATEAAIAIKEYAFANFGFQRLISLVDAENLPSQRVALKNGMRHERDTEFEGLPFRIYAVDRPGSESG